MIYKLLISCLLIVSINNTYAQNKPETITNLNQVIEDFRTSIINHNNIEKFSSLFLHDSITWASINIGETKKIVSEKNPDFRIYSSDYTSFYNFLKSRDSELEEKFYNVQISVRNEFATISFDYSFNVDDQVNNWGLEYWSLILINNRWLITSVTWTTNLQRYEKCPFKLKNQFVFNNNTSNKK